MLGGSKELISLSLGLLTGLERLPCDEEAIESASSFTGLLPPLVLEPLLLRPALPLLVRPVLLELLALLLEVQLVSEVFTVGPLARVGLTRK